MSKLLAVVFLLTISFYAIAQNLVPNPSFESINNCPTSFGQIQCPLVTPPFSPTVNDWISAVPNSPDYYNACSGSIYASVPTHFHGTHPARTGNAYVGIVGYSGYPVNGPSGSYFEYVECQLTQPLVAGRTYIISCYMRMAFKFDPLHTPNIVALRELGALVTTTQTISNTTPINSSFTPLTRSTGGYIDSDTTWIYVSGEYKATGGEVWLTLGSFNDDNVNPDFGQVFPRTTLPLTTFMNYTLIDDVSVVEKPNCDTFYNTYDTILCNSKSLPLNISSSYTDAGVSYLWNNNVTNASVSATSTGKYWCVATKGCNLTVDTFNISLNDDKLYSSRDTLVCSPDSIMISTRDSALSYKWSTGDTTRFITPIEYGSYWCITEVGCSQYTDTIKVNPISRLTSIDLGDDVNVCEEQSVQLGKHYAGDNSYSWNTGDASCCIVAADAGVYTLTVSDQCITLIDSIRIDKHGCKDCFFVPDAFTPNADGLNDKLKPIPQCDIKHYEFRVFNRWGEVVYYSTTLYNGWDGRYKNVPVEIGAYYYYIEYNTHQNDTKKIYKGDVTVIR